MGTLSASPSYQLVIFNKNQGYFQWLLRTEVVEE